VTDMPRPVGVWPRHGGEHGCVHSSQPMGPEQRHIPRPDPIERRGARRCLPI
jgi:hypothetical protein